MKKSFALASLAAPALLLAPVLSVGPAVAAERHDHRVVGWVSCNAGANGMLTYKPRQHVLSCADANSGLRKLTWSSWNSTSATGAGTYYWNDCEPNCAAGTNHTSKATVELKAPKVQKGEKVFTRVIVKYMDEDGNLQVDRMDSVPYLG